MYELPEFPFWQPTACCSDECVVIHGECTIACFKSQVIFDSTLCTAIVALSLYTKMYNSR